MNTDEKYRPTRFSEIVGNKFSVKLLKAIGRNPSNSPRSLIFFGNAGCGKTSSARILPMALNCKTKTGDSCLKCESCREGSELVYYEYNCGHTGNVSFIRDLQESMLYSMGSESTFRVMCFDEIHLASQESQGALLSMLDSAPRNVFFVLCTTNIDHLIPTLRSRSLEIEFKNDDPDDILTFLKRIRDKEGANLSDEVLSRISKRCYKDIRMSINTYQNAIILGEDEFLEYYILLYQDILDLLSYVFSFDFDEDTYTDKINKILKNPSEYIRKDFEQVVIDLSNSLCSNKKIRDDKIYVLILEYLKIQRNISTRAEWNLFFNLLKRYSIGRTIQK